MKLLQELQDIYTKSITMKDVLTVLKNTGTEQYFEFALKKQQFVNFVYYFVNCYSLDSKMMDPNSFKESKKLIAEHFAFDFEKFKTSFGEEFDDVYSSVLSTFLKSQRNRDYELLINGLILYEQMLSASVSKSIITKSKDGTENIDYETKNNLFAYSLKIHKDLQELESKLSKTIIIIDKVEEETQEKTIRPEDNLPTRK